MTNIDRQRFAGALTHPVTIAALATLIVNDLVFKALWPGSWTTGKLSDLAWMAFAPPLLAFLLSLAAPRKPGWDRTIFIAAYVGLPLLYLAYNTFEPLHDTIMGVFMLANRSDYGSPFDPTDSLVIPAGIGIAFWVLRNGSAAPGNVANHGKFLVAVLACFAMVATTYASYQGITRVGVEQGGNRVFGGYDQDRYEWGSMYEYTSSDGGRAWRESNFNGEINWGTGTVATPRGTYRLDGPRILQSVDGDNWTVSYSVERLQTEGNSWIFRKATDSFTTPSTRLSPSIYPRNLVYHEPSGNVIAAWGLQGVLVNTPSGQWHKVAVDRYSPIDFSFAGKSLALLTDGSFIFAMLALSMAATALALALAPFFSRGEWQRKVFALACSMVSVAGAAAALWSFDVPDSYYLLSVGFTSIFVRIAAPFFSIPAIIVSWKYFRHWRAILSGFIGFNLLIILSFSWWLHLGMLVVVAKFAAAALTLLAAIALATYLNWKNEPESERP